MPRQYKKIARGRVALMIPSRADIAVSGGSATEAWQDRTGRITLRLSDGSTISRDTIDGMDLADFGTWSDVLRFFTEP